MRALVRRLWIAYRARMDRVGGRRDLTARRWRQGSRLTAPTGGRRARFRDGFMAWRLNCRRPW